MGDDAPFVPDEPRTIPRAPTPLRERLNGCAARIPPVGSGEPISEVAPTSLEILAIQVDRCAARTELAVKAADRAAEASEETRDLVREMKGVVLRQASDHSRLRHGVPVSWQGRLAIVAIAVLAGALAAVGVVGCVVAFR